MEKKSRTNTEKRMKEKIEELVNANELRTRQIKRLRQEIRTWESIVYLNGAIRIYLQNDEYRIFAAENKRFIGDGVAYAISRAALHEHVGAQNLNNEIKKATGIEADMPIYRVVDVLRDIGDIEMALSFGNHEIQNDNISEKQLQQRLQLLYDTVVRNSVAVSCVAAPMVYPGETPLMKKKRELLTRFIEFLPNWALSEAVTIFAASYEGEVFHRTSSRARWTIHNKFAAAYLQTLKQSVKQTIESRN